MGELLIFRCQGSWLVMNCGSVNRYLTIYHPTAVTKLSARAPLNNILSFTQPETFWALKYSASTPDLQCKEATALDSKFCSQTYDDARAEIDDFFVGGLDEDATESVNVAL